MPGARPPHGSANSIGTVRGPSAPGASEPPRDPQRRRASLNAVGLGPFAAALPLFQPFGVLFRLSLRRLYPTCRQLSGEECGQVEERLSALLADEGEGDEFGWLRISGRPLRPRHTPSLACGRSICSGPRSTGPTRKMSISSLSTTPRCCRRPLQVGLRDAVVRACLGATVHPVDLVMLTDEEAEQTDFAAREDARLIYQA